MKKLYLVGLGGAFALMMSGCMAYTQAPVMGAIYTGVKAPIVATSNTSDSKMGRATCKSILGLVALGDCSIATAAKDGGISHVKSVDYEATSILGIYAESTTIVTGN